MKTIFTFLSFLFILNLVQGQTASVKLINHNDDSTVVDKHAIQQIRNMHSLLAKQEIKKYLAKNLSYDKLMRDNLFEGSLIIEFTISKEGIISEKKITSETSAYLNAYVLKMLEKLTKITPKNDVYLGRSILKMPIKFSM